MGNTKSTKAFKEIIEKYLNDFANKDEAFRDRLQIENKTIDKCITYILNRVQKSGVNGFVDEEIFGMALHYYDEDEIDIGKDLKIDVIVNRRVELTEKEIQYAKDEGRNKFIEEEYQKLKKKNIKLKKNDNSKSGQVSLF